MAACMVLVLSVSGCASLSGNILASGEQNPIYDLEDSREYDEYGCWIAGETNPVNCRENHPSCSPPNIGCRAGWICGADLKCVETPSD